MTKSNAELVLEKEPYETIKWFTLNYDKEIGAVGVGRIEQQRVIVEELFFPTQEVSVATVHINSTDWGPIVKEIVAKYGETEGLEKIKKINFYWHKHPDGSAKPSSTDEESTFDAFMDEEQKRKYFAFLQTCKKSYGAGDIEWEPRIEMRTPIRHTIENVKIVTRELSDIEKTCRKIIETKIKKPEPVAVNNTITYQSNIGYNNNWKKGQQRNNYNNYYHTSSEVAEDDGADYNFKNGCCILEINSDYANYVENSIEKGKLKKLIQRSTIIRMSKTNRYFLYPAAKSYSALVEGTKALHESITTLHQQRAIDAMNGHFYDVTEIDLEDIAGDLAEDLEQEQLKEYEKELNAYEEANKSILKDQQDTFAQDREALKRMME